MLTSPKCLASFLLRGLAAYNQEWSGGQHGRPPIPGLLCADLRSAPCPRSSPPDASERVSAPARAILGGIAIEHFSPEMISLVRRAPVWLLPQHGGSSRQF